MAFALLFIRNTIGRRVASDSFPSSAGFSCQSPVSTFVRAGSFIGSYLPARYSLGRGGSTIRYLTEDEEGGMLLSEGTRSVVTGSKQRRGRKSKPWQGPFAYHEELELTVESLTNLGWGICRASLPSVPDAQSPQMPLPTPSTPGGPRESPESWVVMVPGVIPGERIRLRIYRNHKNYSEADLMHVLESSSERVEPVCPLFGRCGGCQYQHMSVAAQRAWKREHVLQVLARTGNVTGITVQEAIGTEHTLGYRSKITPHHEKPRGGEIREIGFLKLGSRALVDVPECAIATPAINARLRGLREEVRVTARAAAVAETPRKPKGATLLLRETREGVVTDPRAEVSDQVGGLLFKYTAGSFFQNNPYVLPHMVEYVVRKAGAPNVRYLVDAYCGGGLFCLSASKNFEACYGVEISELAILSAQRNAELNKIGNCHFQAGDATDIFAGIGHISGADTVTILDPPRKGCDEGFLTQLCRFRPARIVYVSCDPATQARDARFLLERGYDIEEVQPFDLFPQTRHIENVIVFVEAHRTGAGAGSMPSWAGEGGTASL